jgi:hypothetical protein
MRKLTIAIAMLGLISCKKYDVNQKAYQIVSTKDREYYTTFYAVYHETGCIEFIAYDGNDSSFVKLCEPWDVRPNPKYKQ